MFDKFFKLTAVCLVLKFFSVRPGFNDITDVRCWLWSHRSCLSNAVAWGRVRYSKVSDLHSLSHGGHEESSLPHACMAGWKATPSTEGLLPSFVPFLKPARGCCSQPPKSTPTMPALGSSTSDLNSWNECIFRTSKFKSRFLTFSNIRLKTSLSLPNSRWQNVLLISGRLIKNVHLCTQLARVKVAMISQASQLKSCLMNFWNKMSLSFKTSIISDNEALRALS